MAMIGETNSVCPTDPASGTKAELGLLEEKPLVLVQAALKPEVTAVVQPEGSAGAVTLSKFSEKLVVLIVAPSRMVKLTVPKLVAPSCSCKVAVTVPPQVPLAVKLKGLATAAPPATKAP